MRRTAAQSARFGSIVLALAACVLAAPVAAAPPDDAAVGGRIERLLATGGPIGPIGLDAARLRPFYAARGFRPAWVDDRPRAAAIRDRIAAAANDGLDAADYAIDAIDARWDSRAVESEAELDLLLSRAIVGYANDLVAGRAKPKRVHPTLFVYRHDLDPTRLLEQTAAAADAGRFLAGLAPKSPFYRELRSALATYRAIAEKGGWPMVPAGRTLRPGDEGARVAALRARLAVTDAAPPPEGPPDRLDPALVAVLRGFQIRNGLEADGVLGPRTLAALDVPVADRIRTIVANMERWRWMPVDLGRRHVLVNIAGSTVSAVEDGRTALQMAAVVGRPYRQTPVFSDRITYVEFNPYWNVPRSIARKDILPKLRVDPGYLSRLGFDVLGPDGARVDPATIDWTTVDAARFPYRLRQRPGPENALGRVKIMFPNRYNVYLHDTPARELFDKPTRTFSSGCIRLQWAVELTDFLLAETPDWPPERVREAIADGKTRVVRLSAPVPVHLIYATAWVEADGTVNFRKDIYGRDRALLASLDDGR